MMASNPINSVTYQGEQGIGQNKHIVFIAADQEYRSEEMLPAMARILAKYHGFKCTVLFTINDEGHIAPESTTIYGLDILQDADLLVAFIRQQAFSNEQMLYLNQYLNRGGPVLGLRTSTHAFKFDHDSEWQHYDQKYSGEKTEWHHGFGEKVLGETWVGHHGKNRSQSTKISIEKDYVNHPIFIGVNDIWTQTGLYQAYPKADCQVLALGQPLKGMTIDSPINTNKKPMPAAWIRQYQINSTHKGRVFTTTSGSSQDFLNDGFRRMLINASFWCLGMENNIKKDHNIDIIGQYSPTPPFYMAYKANVKPNDLSGWDSPLLPGESKPRVRRGKQKK